MNNSALLTLQSLKSGCTIRECNGVYRLVKGTKTIGKVGIATFNELKEHLDGRFWPSSGVTNWRIKK